MSTLEPRIAALADQMQAGLAEQQGPDFERLSERLLSIQVCTSLSDEDATTRMNLTASGTTHGWQLSVEPANAPVPCADKPDTHRHLIFDC